MDWAEAEAFNEFACAEVFDVTPCTLQPRREGIGPNHPRTNDSERVIFSFMGTIDLQPTGELMARHRSSDPNADKANPLFPAVLMALVTGWPYMPRKFDRVIVGDDVWEIAADAQDGSMRRAYYLARGRI